MAATIYIHFDVTEQPLSFVTTTCGKALSDPRCKVNFTAVHLNAEPLSKYFASDTSQWFKVSDGLMTIGKLLNKLYNEPSGVCKPFSSIADLEQLQGILTTHEQARFRLQVGS
jgi:hypothetical protein